MSERLLSTVSVPDNERIARIIHQRHVQDDIVSPSAFSLRDRKPPENYMSVHRTDLISLTYEMAARVISRKLYGYAELVVADVHACCIDNAFTKVVPYPTDGNKAHAGIHVIIDGRIAEGKGEACSCEFLEIASQLALCAVPVKLDAVVL